MPIYLILKQDPQGLVLQWKYEGYKVKDCNGQFMSLLGWSIVLALSCVQHFETLWTVVRQAPLPTEFPRQEY